MSAFSQVRIRHSVDQAWIAVASLLAVFDTNKEVEIRSSWDMNTLLLAWSLRLRYAILSGTDKERSRSHSRLKPHSCLVSKSQKALFEQTALPSMCISQPPMITRSTVEFLMIDPIKQLSAQVSKPHAVPSTNSIANCLVRLSRDCGEIWSMHC